MAAKQNQPSYYKTYPQSTVYGPFPNVYGPFPNSGGLQSPLPVGYGETPSNGQVLGATNNNVSPPVQQQTQAGTAYPAGQYVGWDPAAAAADWAAKQARGEGNPGGGNPYEETKNKIAGEINANFEPVFAGLDRLAGILPEQRQNWLDSITDIVNSGSKNIELQKTAETEKLQGSRDELRDKTAQAKRESDTSLRNALVAGGVYLGNKGAGDSSAAGRYSGALAKSASRNTALIQSKANEILGQIQEQESNVRLAYDTAMNNLETWKAEKTSEISNWYYSQVQSIESQRLQATGDKATALANSATTLYQNALQRLNQLQSEKQQYQAGIESWVAERSSDISQFKSQLAQLGNFYVGNLPQNSINNDPTFAGEVNGQSFSPYMNNLNQEETDLRSFLS